MNKAIVTMAISAALAAGALMVAGEAKSAETWNIGNNPYGLEVPTDLESCEDYVTTTIALISGGAPTQDVEDYDAEGTTYHFVLGGSVSSVFVCSEKTKSLVAASLIKTYDYVAKHPEYVIKQIQKVESEILASGVQKEDSEPQERTVYEETGAWYHCTTPSGKVAHVREQGVDLIYTFGRPGKKADIELVKSIDSQMGLKELTFQNGNVDYTMNEDGILVTTNKKDGSTTQIKVTCTVSEGGEYAN